ncbi:MAG TPA: hypothetical protein VFW77_05165 [Candidatus Saccharimonadales bacterium]|nr:hypothetical protein [Candidatus Saccharimonadales bacterium]
MFKNFEQDRGAVEGAGISAGWVMLMVTPGVGWLHDQPHRDWQSRIESLEAQKAKAKTELSGPMHHLAVVETGVLKDKIQTVKSHEPEQFGGIEGVEIMGGLILSGVVLATTATYGIRRAARFVREHNPLAA